MHGPYKPRYLSLTQSRQTDRNRPRPASETLALTPSRPSTARPTSAATTPEAAIARIQSALRHIMATAPSSDAASAIVQRAYNVIIAERGEFPMFDAATTTTSQTPSHRVSVVDPALSPLLRMTNLRREVDKKRNQLNTMDDEATKTKTQLNEARLRVKSLKQHTFEMTAVLEAVRGKLTDRREHLEQATFLNERLRRNLFDSRYAMLGSVSLEGETSTGGLDWATMSARGRIRQLLGEISDLRAIARRLRDHQVSDAVFAFAV